MEYWSDTGGSVYRPQLSMEELQKSANFTYKTGFIVLRFEEKNNEVIVHARQKIDRTLSFSCSAKRFILAAGAIGSARLTLSSRSLFNTPVPFVGKPHVLTACLHPETLGLPGPKKRSSLCQLLIHNTQNRDGFEQGCAQLYSYRSLLLFRLLSSLPLPAPQALKILALLSPSLVIADIRFPAFASAANILSIQPTDTPLVHTSIQMEVSPVEKMARLASLRRLKTAMRQVGLLPLKTLDLPEASTTHYAGTMANRGPGALATDANGKLIDSQFIYVSDSAVFRSLPAKPHTLTIMANANRISSQILSTL